MAAMPITREQHFVPEWYQRRFLPGGTGKHYVLDKTPSTSMVCSDGRVRPIPVREMIRRGPGEFLRLRDLYTTKLFGKPNDEIERRLFGTIDRTGSRAVEVFANWPTRFQV